jgi:protein-disulfide isomerase
MERVLKTFEGQVQFVYYPFSLNPRSQVATQAALCAGEQGKFWAFHHMLYERQAQWSHLSEPLERLGELAKDLGVDPAALKSCVQSGRMQPLVEADKAYGRSLQVRSTPTVFVNTARLSEVTEGDLVRTVRQELARARRTAP